MVNIDETGWRTAGGRRTLWGALSRRAALFRIAADRHRREAQALLGEEFAGIACSDRWWAYDYLDPERRQLCWAHLVRDFTAHSEGAAAQKEFGEAGLEIAGRVVRGLGRTDGAATVRACSNGSPRSKRSCGRCLSRRRVRAPQRTLPAVRQAPAQALAGALDLRQPCPASSPPTTMPNVACAGAVIYRKLSLGSQSEEGERTIERLLSASITCRLQGRSLFAYLSDVFAARIRGDPIPLLA